MLFAEYIHKAKEETIAQAENGLFYLEPMWRTILHDNNLFFNDVSDYEITPEEVEDVLKLEVKRRNTVISKKPFIEDWLHELITTQVEPAMLQEETDYIKNVIEFMKTNHDIEKDNIVQFPSKE